MIANGLTKALTHVKFHCFVEQIDMTQNLISTTTIAGATHIFQPQNPCWTKPNLSKNIIKIGSTNAHPQHNLQKSVDNQPIP